MLECKRPIKQHANQAFKTALEMIRKIECYVMVLDLEHVQYTTLVMYRFKNLNMRLRLHLITGSLIFESLSTVR